MLTQIGDFPQFQASKPPIDVRLETKYKKSVLSVSQTMPGDDTERILTLVSYYRASNNYQICLEVLKSVDFPFMAFITSHLNCGWIWEDSI